MNLLLLLRLSLYNRIYVILLWEFSYILLYFGSLRIAEYEWNYDFLFLDLLRLVTSFFGCSITGKSRPTGESIHRE